MKVPGLFRPEKNLEGNIQKLLIQPEYEKFELVEAGNYAECIAKLKERGGKPFTFAETVKARIADYKANGEDAKLFKNWLDSITGIAHEAKSTKFKIILRSDKLENIAEGFNQIFIPINYDMENGIELDSSKGKYNQSLTKEEVKSHKFWLAAMNGDKNKLAEYVDIWFDKTGKNAGMGVYLRNNTDSDELYGLTLYGDYINSDAYNISLSGYTRFVSGA